ncbi:hypothetical protein HPP92_001881 [Vanilla planifolia]|uniref:Uncharacterized protein n=1 Tax=Vanilla planifolia TaxID=51239 RepID=A0A835RYU9_VANPL|nr:hypothetical protein HPP92_001881 [Vanilla planifolia]
MSFFSSVLFPPPASVFVSSMSVISFASLAITGASEIAGRHLRYSKFWDATGVASIGVGDIRISSRVGMLMLYSPAMVAALASFFVPGLVVDLRAQLVASALAIHFAKRVLEVLFVHQYSGQMILDSAIPISLSYFSATVTSIYAQHLTKNMLEPAMDLKYVGVLLFLVGIFGNFLSSFDPHKAEHKGGKGL